MILTEEQREAIRVISKLPMAIGCQLCHPYIMENYGSHFIVLRDMIDSSGTVEPTGGFDLEAARAADEALPYPLDANEIWVSGKGQMHINPPNAPSIFFTLSDLCEFRNLFHGQAAEIERLRPFEIAARDLDSDLTKIAGERDDQAARIKELEADNQNLVTMNKALMKNDWILRDNNGKYRKRAQKAELLNKSLKSKIGPDAKPQSWQITEERIGLLEYCLETLLDAPDIEEIPGPGHSIEMLRAMLREAEQ